MLATGQSNPVNYLIDSRALDWRGIAAEDLQISQAAQVIVKCRGLKNRSQLFQSMATVRADLIPADAHNSAGRPNHSQHHTDSCALPCPVMAKQPVYLAFWNSKAYTIDRHPFAEPFTYVLEFDQELGRVRC